MFWALRMWVILRCGTKFSCLPAALLVKAIRDQVGLCEEDSLCTDREERSPAKVISYCSV